MEKLTHTDKSGKAVMVDIEKRKYRSEALKQPVISGYLLKP
jgi:hypothetical protein